MVLLSKECNQLLSKSQELNFQLSLFPMLKHILLIVHSTLLSKRPLFVQTLSTCFQGGKKECFFFFHGNSS